MKQLLSFFFALAMLAVLSAPSLAGNRYYRPYYGYSQSYCGPYGCNSYGYSPNYYSGYGGYNYGKSYGYRQYNLKSAWAYAPWSKDASYFIHYYTCYEWYESPHCYGPYTTHNDGWLYTYSDDCYHKHCLISAYGVKQIGAASYGYDKTKHEFAKIDPKLAGYIQAQTTSPSINILSILAPFQSTSEARLEAVVKDRQSSAELAALEMTAQATAERDERLARLSFAENQAKLQAYERGLREFHQGFAAALTSSAAFSSSAVSLPIDDPALAKVVTENCFSCHGGDQGVKGGIDFRQASTFDAAVWKRCRNAVLSGRMPKDGQPLDEATADLFDLQYERARGG